MKGNRILTLIIMSMMLFSGLFMPFYQMEPAKADEPNYPSNTHTFGFGNPEEPDPKFFYNDSGTWKPINTTIVPKAITISGKAYQWGVTGRWYSAYFRQQSSDTNTRPVALFDGNYTLTQSQDDFVILSPHKYTTNGRIGNRVQSNAVITGSNLTYPGFYEKVGTSGSFASISFSYEAMQLKEYLTISDKAYLRSKYTSQCNIADYNIINLTYDTVIRAYDTSDQDSKTLGIVYGEDLINWKTYGLFEDKELITNESIDFTDSYGNVVYTISDLYAYDSAGHQIELTKKISMTRFGNLVVTVLVPYKWLNETAVFPVTIDPTFGASGVFSYIPFNLEDYSGMKSHVWGNYNSTTVSGDADYISIYLDVNGGYNQNVTCALYEYVDHATVFAGDLVAQTEVKKINADGWYTFYFTPKPHLSALTKYYITAWAEANSTSTTYVETMGKRVASTHGAIEKSMASTMIAPDPLTGDSLYSCAGYYYEVKMYCSYTEVQYPPDITDALIFNTTDNEEKNLNATNVDLLPTCFNITIDDDNSDTMNITLRTNQSGVWQTVNSSIGLSDGTFSFFNTTWIDTWNTKYWLSVNLTDTNGNWTNATYWFITGTIPQLGNPVSTPNTGNESDTMYNISCNITDIDNDSQAAYCNVSLGSWYSNNSMSWVHGDNDTGAMYRYISTYPFVGILTVTIYTYDGSCWNHSSSITITVLGNASFQLNFPLFLEVGQYIMADGILCNATGGPLNGIWSYTRILNSTYDQVFGSLLKRYIVNGEYRYVFSTTIMTPDIYYIVVNFTYGGNSFSTNNTLYLSTPGPGHYATDAYFTFYNSNTGLGLEPTMFKIYASDTTILARIYGNTYHNTYTGQILHYRIDDYFDNQVYPLTGSYANITITDLAQGIDVPIIWYDVAIKNLNTTILLFSLQNGTTFYNATLFPGDSYHFSVLAGVYTITKFFYCANNHSLIDIVIDTLTVTQDTYYIATGYLAHVYFNIYNTNEGIGLNQESLKIYINGTRIIGNQFTGTVGKHIHVNVTDYYNTSLWNGNFTLNETFLFIDLGLTFHSWKFGNSNNKYYIISLLKIGATRYWERGIVPYGELEFFIPSGMYRLRIYDASYSMLINTTYLIANSRVYVINGSNLTLIINGLSVVVGNLLQSFDYALTPDIVTIGFNPPMVYSVYDVDGMSLGNGIYKICPAVITIATTKTTQNGNWINSSPIIPTNGSVTNGTVTILKDELYIAGNASIAWVNITYTGNGTTMQNTTYIPSKIDLYGQNITINASEDITVKRDTKYNQLKKFYWTYYSYEGRYETGINISNPMPTGTPIYDVYAYVEFANDTNPDFATVTMRDVANNGTIMKRGENFDVSAGGIHFYLLSINGSSSRTFTIEYHKAVSESYSYGVAEYAVNGYDETVFQGGTYHYFYINWVNTDNLIFKGTLNVKLNFDDVLNIDPNSIVLQDTDNNIVLNSDGYTQAGNVLSLGSSIIGDVNPGGGRSFTIYFIFDEFPGANPLDYKTTTPLFYLLTIAITPFLIGLVVFGFILIFSTVLYTLKNKNKNRNYYKVGIAISLLIIFFLILLQQAGL